MRRLALAWTRSEYLALLTLGISLAACQKSTSTATSSSSSDAAVEASVINATVLPVASVAAMVNPRHLPPYLGATGSVEGTIFVVGDPPVPTPSDFSKCPAAEAIWSKSFREGQHYVALGTGQGPPDEVDARTLADAVVAVTGYSGAYVPEKDEGKQINIEGCGYASRTVTITFGQRIEVKNFSKDFWTPVLQPGSTMVMMMVSPNADPVRLYPKQPGRYLIVDRDRKYVDVDVFVLLNPLHAVSDLNGHYRIDGVPVGKVTVNTMHPRFIGEKNAEVEIKAGLIQHVDLTLRHTHVPYDAGPPKDAGYRPQLH